MSLFFFSGLNVVKEIASTLSRDTNYIQVCGYAARKGTREKMRKKKVKVEIKKVGFIPHNLREKGKAKGPFVSRRLDDSFKGHPVDNVWAQRFYQWRMYNFKEAVVCHRETHHPQLYNQPNAPLQAFIELNMTGVKKTKFVDPFTRMASVAHEFDHGDKRSILVFCKTPELKEAAENAGATSVYDVDIIRKIEKGDLVLPDFQFVLAHPNILPELVALRGLLKRKFPNPKLGTIGASIGDLVKKFNTGIYYSALRDESELDYGWIEATIGTLNMEIDALEENFKSLISDINTMKPKRPGTFITRVLLKSPPSVERLKLNLDKYLEEEEYESDSDDELEARA
uniref:Mitochondrial ribosomal protein L1 n=1 Tax=Riptortus pedestris TaxID=329032 RepID=R4WPM2_RIPPE|nr:mitochondrial ribosomal protein L1 [Riptortus pedestris]